MCSGKCAQTILSSGIIAKLDFRAVPSGPRSHKQQRLNFLLRLPNQPVDVVIGEAGRHERLRQLLRERYCERLAGCSPATTGAAGPGTGLSYLVRETTR